MQSVLGAAVENVGRGRGPFALEEIGGLALEEVLAEAPAEIGERAGGADQGTGAGAVKPAVVLEQGSGHPRIVATEIAEELLEIGIGDVAARQMRVRRPGLAHRRKERLDAVQRVLGELAEGGDLAAEDRQQRRLARRRVELENIVARHRAWVVGVVVVERPDTGEGIDDIAA